MTGSAIKQYKTENRAWGRQTCGFGGEIENSSQMCKLLCTDETWTLTLHVMLQETVSIIYMKENEPCKDNW